MGFRLFVAFSCFAGCCAAASAASPLVYTIVADRTNALYACTQRATFTVAIAETNGLPPRAGEVRVRLDNFGTQEVAKATWDLVKTNVFSVSGRLKEPGFLRLALEARGTPTRHWSVAYEPEKIVKGSPSPADFDDFWRTARDRYRRDVPESEPEIVRVPERSTADFDFYRISFATYARRVYGYLAVPTKKHPAPYPVDFEANAAGFGGWTNDLQPRKGAICLRFSVYPFEPHWQWRELGLRKTYEAMNAACREKWGVIYCHAGISKSREDYFFYPVLLALDRAVDWVVARKDVDRTRVLYHGTSQGGGLGFCLAGLNGAFTRAALFVPAMTDTMGSLKGRQSGWPRIVESQPEEGREAAARHAPYFDGANFASRIRCPVRVTVGFSDTTCAPCAVYAAYNAIPVKDKEIYHGLGMGHSCHPAFYRRALDWLYEKP